MDSGWVRLAEQVVGSRRAVVTAVDEEGRQITVDVEAGDTGYQCVGVSIDGGDAPITGDTLRRIPVKALVSQAAALTGFQVHPDEGATFGDWGTPWPDFVMKEWPHGNLSLVAHWTAGTYAMAAFNGQGPTKAVREAAGVAQSTAGRMIKSARDLGILTTPAPSQTGGTPARLISTGTETLRHDREGDSGGA